MNKQFYLVYDFETDGVDPNTCNPVELAAVPVEPRRLDILKEEHFKIIIKPPDIDNPEYLTDERLKTIQWHAKNKNITPEDVIASWKNGFEPKTAWEMMAKYAEKYTIPKTRGHWYTEPIPVGYNIICFDNIIAKRLSDQYNIKYPFSAVKKIDLQDLLFTWFENLQEPANMKMDTLRAFFDIQSDGFAHEALTDVMDEALMLVKFLKFHRKQASVKKFKGAFNERAVASIS